MKKLFLLSMIAILFIGCSKDAEDSANSTNSFKDEDINGIWKESGSGVAFRITGTSSTVYGNGYLNQAGNVFPSSAVGGRCLSEVEMVRGGYYEAYNWTYTGTTWVKGGVIGLAMNDAKTYFKIGSKFYYRQ